MLRLCSFCRVKHSFFLVPCCFICLVLSSPKGVGCTEQKIDERTLNSVFQVSVKTTFSAVFSEKLPLFTAFLILTTLNNEYFFPLRPEKLIHFYKICRFPTLNDDSAAHCPALKNTLSHRFFFFFCSNTGNRLGSKRPPWLSSIVINVRLSAGRAISKQIRFRIQKKRELVFLQVVYVLTVGCNLWLLHFKVKR